MNLPDESNVCLKGVKYSLIKARPTEGEGYAFVIDEKDRARETFFLTPDIAKALSLLLKR